MFRKLYKVFWPKIVHVKALKWSLRGQFLAKKSTLKLICPARKADFGQNWSKSAAVGLPYADFAIFRDFFAFLALFSSGKGHPKTRFLGLQRHFSRKVSL